MDSFLEEIVHNYRGQINLHNNEFFSKYFDGVTVDSLLKLTSCYSTIIDLLKERHDKRDKAIMQKLDEELKKVTEKVNTIKDSQTELCNDKLENTILRTKMYQEEEVNFNKIEKLNELDNKINTMLAGNDEKLEKSIDEKKSKTAEHKEVKEKQKEKHDIIETKIESAISRLNELFDKLKSKDINVLNELNSDELKEKYEQSMVDIIRNDTARKAYTNYLFDGMKRESRIVSETYETAQQFMANTTKENGFDVPELVGKNDQIGLYTNVTGVAYDSLNQFASVWCQDGKEDDKGLTAMANTYLSTQPFIDEIYDYIDNLSIYSQDKSKGDVAYDKLSNFYRQQHEKLGEIAAKDSRRPINVVNKTINKISPDINKPIYGSVEIESNEFSVRMFERFRDGLKKLRIQPLDTKKEEMQNDQPLKHENSSQQQTEELENMLTMTVTSSNTNDTILTSGEMVR